MIFLPSGQRRTDFEENHKLTQPIVGVFLVGYNLKDRGTDFKYF